MTGKLDDETWAKRLEGAARDGKLNVSYMDLPTFDAARVLEIKEKIPNLVELDLRSNDLAELPDELAELKNLRNVKLTYNKFESIPPVLTKLKRLTSLNMGGCLLRDVDDVVGDLSSRFLRDLDLSGNRVQTVSPAIARHDKLSYLNLENNSIVNLPEEMGEMENLSVLDLSNNQLVALPETFGGLKGLTRIEVNNNRIEELPPSMGHLTNLKDFDVRYNELREPGRTKALGSLSGLLKFLRDEEQRLIQEEIERLKPVATAVGKYLEYRTKIEAKGNNEGNGGPGDPMDDRPYLRTGHTLTHGANHLFIFGGALAYHDKRKGNDLFVTNLDRVVWRKTSAYGAGAPRERDGHAAVFDAIRRRLLIFGGKSKEKKRLDDLYAYYLDEDRWTPLSPDGRRPDAREGAKMVALDENTAVLFGGKGQGARFNDVYVLDMSTKDCAWSTPVCSGAIPTPRQDVALCASDGVVYLHAGRDNFVRDDLYALDLSDRANPAWEELAVSGRRPMPCYGHELAFVDGKLWTYGGFDELGGQCSKVYRLDFTENVSKRGVGLDKTDGAWTEMESELSLNESRVGVISPDGTLHTLQVGSADAKVGAGAVSTPEEMYWDVYKVGDVLDLDERELRPEDLIPVNGKKLRVEHTTTSKGKEYPPRVRAGLMTNTRSEEKMLAYVDEFRAKFAEFYPDRRPLLLDPPNECGVRKFVCTTVRPSKLEHTSLYDLRPCCEFVANYLEYEQLESPLLFPSAVPSPYTVMEWQAGDCFDLAVALCSLLAGVGYDAYVCVGYAPKRVTTNDQTEQECPVLEREAARRAREAEARANAPAPEAKQSKYKVKRLIDLTSKLELEDAATAREEARAAKEATKARKRFEKEERRKRAEAEAAAADAMERASAAAAPAAASAAASQPGSPGREKLAEAAEGGDAGESAAAEGEGDAAAPAGDGDEAAAADGEASGETEAEAAEDPSAVPEPGPEETADATAETAAETLDLGAAAPEAEADPAAEEARLDKKYEGKRVHAWVLVRAGKREVDETVFIEPTTARRYPVDASPYQGLECVWNHVNYWVNAQSGTWLGAPGESARGIDFDLDDPAKWEACLEVEKIEIPVTEEAEDEVDVEEEEEEEEVPAEPEARSDEDAAAETDAEPEEDSRSDAEAASSASLSASADETTSAEVPVEADDEPSTAPEPPPEPENEYLDHDPYRVAVERPPSWVPKLKISQEAFDTRCPRGHKTVKYKKCVHEMFAVFGPCMRWDGMVERLCVFEDEACVTLLEERQTFARRKDRLRERLSFHGPDGAARVERFEPGAAFGARETTLAPDRDRRTEFYPGGRQDGLRVRHEEFGRKMTETFAGRDDCLVYRAVTYDEEETALRAAEAEAHAQALAAAEAAAGKRRVKKKKVEPPPPVIAKISTRFELPDVEALRRARLADDPDGPEVAPAHDRVEKRVFDLKNGVIRVEYHRGLGRVTANARTFFKDGSPPILTRVDPTAPPLTDVEVAEEMHAQRLAEKACVADLRDAEAERDDFVKNRAKEEANVELLAPYYDAMRVKREDDDEEEVEVRKTLDYLSPYMPPLLAGETMSAEEAAATREKCLAATRAQLDARRAIVDRREGEEKAAAAKRRSVYARDADLLTKKEVEAYHKANEDTAFLVKILDRRRSRHDAHAAAALEALEKKMRADPRMAALFGTER